MLPAWPSDSIPNSQCASKDNLCLAQLKWVSGASVMVSTRSLELVELRGWIHPQNFVSKCWWKCFAAYKWNLFAGSPCGYPCCFTEHILLLFLRKSISPSSSFSLRIGGFRRNSFTAEWPWCKNSVPAQDRGLWKNTCFWQFYCNLLWVWNKIGRFLWFDSHFCTYIW